MERAHGLVRISVRLARHLAGVAADAGVVAARHLQADAEQQRPLEHLRHPPVVAGLAVMKSQMRRSDAVRPYHRFPRPQRPTPCCGNWRSRFWILTLWCPRRTATSL